MSRNHARLHRGRWQATRRLVFDRDGWRCTRCGFASRLEAHHEPPLRAGADPYDLAGIVTLCRGCHIGEHREQCIPGQQAWVDLLAERLADPDF